MRETERAAGPLPRRRLLRAETPPAPRARLGGARARGAIGSRRARLVPRRTLRAIMAAPAAVCVLYHMGLPMYNWGMRSGRARRCMCRRSWLRGAEAGGRRYGGLYERDSAQVLYRAYRWWE